MSQIPTYHGPSLAAWLIEEGLFEQLTFNQQRTVRAWQNGQQASERTVDALLCSVERNLREIPVHVALGCDPEVFEGFEFRYSLSGERWLEW